MFVLHKKCFFYRSTFNSCSHFISLDDNYMFTKLWLTTKIRCSLILDSNIRKVFISPEGNTKSAH